MTVICLCRCAVSEVRGLAVSCSFARLEWPRGKERDRNRKEGREKEKERDEINKIFQPSAISFQNHGHWYVATPLDSTRLGRLSIWFFWNLSAGICSHSATRASVMFGDKALSRQYSSSQRCWMELRSWFFHTKLCTVHRELSTWNRREPSPNCYSEV